MPYRVDSAAIVIKLEMAKIRRGEIATYVVQANRFQVMGVEKHVALERQGWYFELFSRQVVWRRDRCVQAACFRLRRDALVQDIVWQVLN